MVLPLQKHDQIQGGQEYRITSPQQPSYPTQPRPADGLSKKESTVIGNAGGTLHLVFPGNSAPHIRGM